MFSMSSWASLMRAGDPPLTETSKPAAVTIKAKWIFLRCSIIVDELPMESLSERLELVHDEPAPSEAFCKAIICTRFLIYPSDGESAEVLWLIRTHHSRRIHPLKLAPAIGLWGGRYKSQHLSTEHASLAGNGGLVTSLELFFPVLENQRLFRRLGFRLTVLTSALRLACNKRKARESLHSPVQVRSPQQASRPCGSPDRTAPRCDSRLPLAP